MEEATTGITMKLGRYMLVLILLVFAVLFLVVYSVLESQGLKNELEEIKSNKSKVSSSRVLSDLVEATENDLEAIYLILAQQSSQMRLVMNSTITRDHWSKHTGNVPQIDCPECVRIYQEIAKQTKELEDMGLPKNVIHERLRSLGYKDTLESKGVEADANER